MWRVIIACVPQKRQLNAACRHVKHERNLFLNALNNKFKRLVTSYCYLCPAPLMLSNYNTSRPLHHKLVRTLNVYIYVIAQNRTDNDLCVFVHVCEQAFSIANSVELFFYFILFVIILRNFQFVSTCLCNFFR